MTRTCSSGTPLSRDDVAMTVHHLDRAPHREPVVVPADDEAARLERMRATTGESDARAHADVRGRESCLHVADPLSPLGGDVRGELVVESRRAWRRRGFYVAEGA